MATINDADRARRQPNALGRLPSPTGGSTAPLYWRDPATMRSPPGRPAEASRKALIARWASTPERPPAQTMVLVVALAAIGFGLALLAAVMAAAATAA